MQARYRAVTKTVTLCPGSKSLVFDIRELRRGFFFENLVDAGVLGLLVSVFAFGFCIVALV